MRIIDLLNKINNNEEIPEKVKYEDTIFEYSKKQKEYIHKINDWYSETLLFKVMNTHFISDLLRTEVEVLEENKEIEELLADAYTSPDTLNKINELVLAVNKLNKEREEK